LGVLLLEYLEHYGRHFRYTELGISVRNGGSYFQRAKRSFENHRRGPDKLFCIENPRVGWWAKKIWLVFCYMLPTGPFLGRGLRHILHGHGLGIRGDRIV
jgi:hypothetical protein